MSWELDWSAIIAGAVALGAVATTWGAQRRDLAALRDDHKALEARVEKVEQLAQAVNALGQQLSQSINHLGEKFASEMRHMAELQDAHNRTVSEQLSSIRDEQRSFMGKPARRRTQ